MLSIQRFVYNNFFNFKGSYMNIFRCNLNYNKNTNIIKYNNDNKSLIQDAYYYMYITKIDNKLIIKINNKYIIILGNNNIINKIYDNLLYNKKFLIYIAYMYNKFDKYFIIYIKKNNYLNFKKMYLKN